MKKTAIFSSILVLIAVLSLSFAKAWEEISIWYDGVYCQAELNRCDFTIQRDFYNDVPEGYQVKWKYKFDNEPWTPWMYENDDFYHVIYPFEETGTHDVKVIFETEPKGYRTQEHFTVISEVWPRL